MLLALSTFQLALVEWYGLSSKLFRPPEAEISERFAIVLLSWQECKWSRDETEGMGWSQWKRKIACRVIGIGLKCATLFCYEDLVLTLRLPL
ncbi:hypothetical protein PGIGA_G00186430 [Pangasianodon gigas]|uniref:Uncharacterized protein n=1 Tax=Pangasianodon gigas TaxID=30993 RepID=A0ACC5WB07_PANGG|nr:hypothetical protein [Pangasianodon gigas]